MQQGNAPCMHLDGEHCSKCSPEEGFKEAYKVQVKINEDHISRIRKLEKAVNILVDKIAEIANYMYREK